MLEKKLVKEINQLRKKLSPAKELEVWGKVYMNNTILMRAMGVNTESEQRVEKFFSLLAIELREEVKKNALKSWRRYFPFKSRN